MAKQNFKTYRETKYEKLRKSFVDERLKCMDTKYRKSLIAMAELGQAAVDGIATEEDRVSNAELLKVPISYAVIMQRLSTLADNPSRAIYKTDSKDTSRIKIAEQMNKWDKIEGCYDATYLNLMQSTETKGTCFWKQGWHEEQKEIDGKPVTIGKMFTSQVEIPIKQFFWDASANELRGDSGNIANDGMDFELLSLLDLKLRYGFDKNYKNINAVRPVNGADVFFTSNVDLTKNSDDSDVPPSDSSREVVLWHYYCRNFFDEETGTVTDKYLAFANGVEIRNSEIPLPKIKGKAQLPYGKFVAVPTGGMGGISMPAIIRHPELALQRMITMADAQAEIAINPIQFMSSGIMNTINDTPLLPGARVEVSMQGRTVADEIYFHTAPDITNGAQYIISKMLELIVIITGVDIHAMFESPKAKAVSTERKREIQEKLLRFSVIYNESHGFFHLEEMRLHIMLQNYPVKRYMLEKQEDGTEKVVKTYPRMPIDGYQVKVIDGYETANQDKKKYKLIKSPRSFNLLTLNPANIEYNIHLYVKGATDASNDDTFELNKNLEKATMLGTNQWTSQVIDPIKASRKIFEMLNIDENEWIKEEMEKSNNDMHGAMKEIQALMMKDIQEIPIRLDEDYDAKEYTEVFSKFIGIEEFKNLSYNVRNAIIERYQYHLKNNLNPYYKEQLQLAQQIEAQNAQVMGQSGVEAAQANMVEPSNPNELTSVVDSKAGKLGKAGKMPTQNRQDQTKIL